MLFLGLAGPCLRLGTLRAAGLPWVAGRVTVQMCHGFEQPPRVPARAVTSRAARG